LLEHSLSREEVALTETTYGDPIDEKLFFEPKWSLTGQIGSKKERATGYWAVRVACMDPWISQWNA
jgi:hypothetical protein